MSGSRHLAESLGRFALPLMGTQAFLQTSINRRRCRSFGLTRTVKRGFSLHNNAEQCSTTQAGPASIQPAAIQPADGGDEVLNARRWQRILANYSTPSRLRSIAELAITALPLIVLWAAAWYAFSLGHAWA
jgi:hypothetical protein